MLFVDQEHTANSWSGLRFGPYTIIETLQRGGMGEVLLAEKTESDGSKTRVVLKRLKSDLLEDDKYVRMFRAEVGVMSRLDHPNIVKVIDLPVIDGKDCLAMEYVQGANAHHLVKRCRKLNLPLPGPLAVYVISEVLLGLEYAHNFMFDDGCSLELVHRDLTPGNILISFLGEVKITDFGIAKSRMSDLSTTVGCVKGTTRYLSPEQIRGESATPRSDLFSTGIVLVEMLTGRALFDRGSIPPTLFAILNGERPPIANILPFGAPKLAAVLERVLSTDAKQRPDSARSLRAELIVAACELGPLGDRPTLARFLREIFPTQASARSGENLELTYLVEIPEVAIIQESTAAEIKDVVDQMALGARPLDANHFKPVPTGLTEGLTVPETNTPTPVVELPPFSPRGLASLPHAPLPTFAPSSFASSAFTPSPLVPLPVFAPLPSVVTSAFKSSSSSSSAYPSASSSSPSFSPSSYSSSSHSGSAYSPPAQSSSAYSPPAYSSPVYSPSSIAALAPAPLPLTELPPSQLPSREGTPTAPAGPNSAAIARAERHAGMIWLFVLGVVFGVGLMFFFNRSSNPEPVAQEKVIRTIAPVVIDLPEETTPVAPVFDPTIEPVLSPVAGPVVAPVVAPVKAPTEKASGARASRRKSRARRAR